MSACSGSRAPARPSRWPKIVEAVQKPTLVIAPNKTLAAQLANEFREFFPHNSVEYFVSYYDYYQPEAYIPSSDTYIEKDCSINEEVERLRHRATMALLTRRDVLIVASVSCIFGLGSPDEYREHVLMLSEGEDRSRRGDAQARGAAVRAQRPQLRARQVPGPRRHAGDLPGRRRQPRGVRRRQRDRTLRGRELAYRVEFFGDAIERIRASTR